MRNATRLTVSTFGALAGLAGIEHGIGEMLQGNVAPAGMAFLSWPDSESFAILGGEPAMTIIPNLLISGILTILVAIVFLLWVTLFIQRKHGGLVLIGLSLVLLLVGGGFGPPLLGLILGVTATRINRRLTWWRAHLPPAATRMLAALWPWSYGVALIAWLLLFPGWIIVDYFVGLENADNVIVVTILAAFGLLLTTIVASFAHEIEQSRSMAGAQELQPA